MESIAQDVLLKFHAKLTAKLIDLAKAVRYSWKAAGTRRQFAPNPAKFARGRWRWTTCCKNDGIAPTPTELLADAVSTVDADSVAVEAAELRIEAICKIARNLRRISQKQMPTSSASGWTAGHWRASARL